MSKVVGHMDMDAFFAAVEERNKPRLKGLPIAVGADPMEGKGRGVVSTANYKAREYGIHSAMPISLAWRLSEKAREEGKPTAVFLSVDINTYAAVSERIINILRRNSPEIEQVSVDEAYFDAGSSYEGAEKLALKIKNEIEEKEGLTSSIGLGPNKLIAKIVSSLRKPDGLTMIREEEAEKFLEPLSVRKIPGIGPKAEETLKKIGVATIKDLKGLTREKMKGIFGKAGDDFYERARARDDSPIQEEELIKSIGGQETFLKDTLDAGFLTERVASLCLDVYRRFKESGFHFYKTVTITVRLADFSTKTRTFTLPEPASDLKTFEFEILKLFMPFLDSRENSKRKLIRLIGARMEKMS